MAAFWEYARESDAIRAYIRFIVAWRANKGQVIGPPFTSEYLITLGFDELALLDVPPFPSSPFKQAFDDKLIPDRLRNNKQFGIGGICSFELESSSLFLRVPPSSNVAPPYVLYGVGIDWSYTDRKLAGWFENQLKRLRPPDSPEPRRPGRHGLSSDLAPIEMLNQLAAFRLNRIGLKASQAKEIFGSIDIYQSGRSGWLKAIKAARYRIDRMTKVRFFEPPKKKSIN